MIDVDVGGNDVSDAGSSDDTAVVAGIIAAQMTVGDRPAQGTRQVHYREPDYGAVWGRRWRVMRVVLLVFGLAAVVLFGWAALRS